MKPSLIVSDVDRAAAVVDQGGIIVYPTETLWGIGGDASRSAVRHRIADLKGRDRNKPFLVLVASAERTSEFVEDVPEWCARLMRLLWPGPLTLLFKPSPAGRQLVPRGTDRVGIRVSSHTVASRLVARIAAPMISTSANVGGMSGPASLDEVPLRLREAVDLVLTGGETPSGLASTIIDAAGSAPVLVRQGQVSFDKVRAAAHGRDG